jgi:hypothetical protein
MIETAAGVLVAAIVVLGRWCSKLTRRLQEQGERIARLEGEIDERTDHDRTNRHDPPP